VVVVSNTGICDIIIGVLVCVDVVAAASHVVGVIHVVITVGVVVVYIICASYVNVVSDVGCFDVVVVEVTVVGGVGGGEADAVYVVVSW